MRLSRSACLACLLMGSSLVAQFLPAQSLPFGETESEAVAPSSAGSAGVAEEDAVDPNLITRCFTIPIIAVDVAATEAGVLAKLEVEEGDAVELDQLVAKIDDREAVAQRQVAMHQYQAAKKQAENEITVEAADKATEVAKAEMDTALDANRRTPNAFSTTEVRKLRLNWERSGLQTDMARHENVVAALEARAKYSQYEQAGVMIERRQLKAPHPGVVMQVFKRQGNWVSPGDKILRLVRMDKLKVTGRVSASAFHWRDVVGRPVEVTVTLAGGKQLKVGSKIIFAGQEVEEDGTYRITCEIDNQLNGSSWQMGPGLEASIRLL
jgi:multidrug resistance efflux pump